MERMRLKTGGLVWVALAAALGMCGIAIFCYYGAQDNDQWWLLATGRWIAEHGIPYDNPFSLYGDQAIVIQQWLACLLDWVAYSLGGYVGLGILVLVMSLCVFCSVAALARTIMDGNLDIACIVSLLFCACASSYMSIRPQMWSMLAFCAVLFVMERYRKTNSWKILIWLIPIMIVHANVHMAMMPYDLFIVACYLFPNIQGHYLKCARASYKRLPIVIVLVVMAACAFANPYGIDGALYLLNSYDAASYGNYIAEMGSTPTTTYYGMMMIVMVVVGAVSLGRLGLSHFNAPVTILYFVALALSFQHTRNVWLVALFAVPLAAAALSRIHFNPRTVFLRDDAPKVLIIAAGIVLMLALGITGTTEDLVKDPKDSTNTPVAAADWLDSHAEGDVGVFTHFNAGGYLEWRGYKVAMDARPELWDSKISKNGQDRYHEYIDMSKDKMEPATYMEDKDFDYMIVNTDTNLYKYLLASTSYKVVQEGDGYVLFRAV